MKKDIPTMLGIIIPIGVILFSPVLYISYIQFNAFVFLFCLTLFGLVIWAVIYTFSLDEDRIEETYEEEEMTSLLHDFIAKRRNKKKFK